MEAASPAQKCQAMESSGPEQNTLGEKHELSTEQLHSESMETRIVGSDGQNCQMTESSSLKQKTSQKKHEHDSEHTQNEPTDTKIVEYNAEENCQTIESSSPLPNESQGKHELGLEHVQIEAMETRIVGSDAKNCETMESSSPKHNTTQEKNELGSEHAQSGPMETKIVESNAENCQTIKSSSPKQNTSLGNHVLCSEHAQSEPMDTKILGSNAQENCQTIESSSPKQNILQGKRELGSEHAQNEPMETKIIESNAQESYKRIESSSLKQNSLQGKHELGSEHAQSEPMETKIVEFSAQENCPTIESSSPKQNTSQGEHELGSEHAQSEPVEIKIEESSAQENCQTIESSSLKQNRLQGKHEIGSEHAQSEPMETKIVESSVQENCQTIESSSPKQNTSQEKQNSRTTESSSPQKSMCGEKNELGLEHVQSATLEIRIVGSDSVDIEQLGTPPKDAAQSTNRSSQKKNQVSSRPLKRKYMLRSSISSPTVLQSSSHGTSKPPDPSISANVSSKKEKKRKKCKSTKKTLNDEFSRIRKHLRYLINRMGYEHNLIDAYSGEGWKGLSMEKIKPEQELQRATSEILRCKLKIRDLFQHLDSLCAEGRLQPSLFDSEGQICSEDIFCAKCGSKDLSDDNDIILCDGICDRGFHLMCLNPPLTKDKIPPEDEGWLCPGCDCKVDCIYLLNDIQGTNLSIDDKWEKVFPEAAATGSGDNPDDNLGFPSDDSEDNDYDPDGPELDERVQTEDSSSEESDFTSASDDLGASPHEDQYLGLPSDDSEDDDYDPNAPDVDEQIKKESSSSDFTSDSEASTALSDGKGSSGTNLLVHSSVDGAKLLTGSSNRRSQMGRKKKQSINAELQSILEPGPSQGNASPVLSKRNRERLDYKKLHDEAYGNVPSDSSDDEEWTDTEAPRKRKNDGGIGNTSVVPPKGNSQTTRSRTNTRATRRNLKDTENTPTRRTRQKLDGDGAYNIAAETCKDSLGPDCTVKVATASASRKNTGSTKRNLKKTKNTPKRRTRQKLDFEGADNLAAETPKDSLGPDSSGKIATATPSRTLGKAVTQGLLESFRENEYPTRDKKENLAKELGITPRQVSKWFENARRSFRQSSNLTSGTNKVSHSKDTALTLTNGKLENLNEDGPSNGDGRRELCKAGTVEDVDRRKCVTEQSTPRESTSSNLRNRKNGKFDDRTPKDASSTKETQIKGATPDSGRVQANRKNGRNTNKRVTRSQIQTRSRKAVT